MNSDTVAQWNVPLNDGLHKIEFEHGTTTGKRVIRVDGNVILKKDWMFKLVGNEHFTIGNAKCVIRVDPIGGFSYSYSLMVNGKSFKTFTEIQSRALKTWLVHFDDETYRVVLEKGNLDIWANGQKLDVASEFVEDGTETHFTLGEWPACIKAVTSGNRREGIIHHLLVNDQIVPERIE
ncbi:hypothetical protein RUM44_006232 [Polyplax serrata]|uniref:Fas apoptotic inhibitory molecule 1 n=1 Tax=Polyplax serrata TaxID=468196 RepID=A0ABR1AHK8_POLSC